MEAGLSPPHALPSRPAEPQAGGLAHGLWAGTIAEDPVDRGPRDGRLRRWCYAAAGDDAAALGAAVVDLGFVAASFAWARLGGRTLTWERRFPLARGAQVGAVPADGALAQGRWGRLALAGDGSIDLDVPIGGGRLVAQVKTEVDVEPAVLVTSTPGGGWNATQKAAGTVVSGVVRAGGGPPHELDREAGGWRDWTVGRQDRVTSWRWMAGAGGATDGRRVGLNASTGMNGAEAGEDLVWWDGRPYGLAVEELTPVDAAVLEGRWRLAGAGWMVELDPVGVRAKRERLPLVSSRYVQPIGRLTGILPDPGGTGVRVRLAGVTEDHHATW